MSVEPIRGMVGSNDLPREVDNAENDGSSLLVARRGSNGGRFGGVAEQVGNGTNDRRTDRGSAGLRLRQLTAPALPPHAQLPPRPHSRTPLVLRKVGTAGKLTEPSRFVT